jgi:hypothetical protein
MDLETMHGALYRDKYLTPADFLADVRKIAHNADAHRGADGERALRAHALLNAAEVALLELEPPLRDACEAAARRERARRAERKEARRAVEAEVEPADGVRRSTRGRGAPLAVDLNANPDAALRRVRSARGSPEERTPPGEAKKRAREEEPADADMDALELPGPPEKRARSEGAPAVPRGMDMLMNPTPPVPEHPEFTVPEDGLAALQDALVGSTGALGVERLEQLRAACVGAVWRARASWDRGPLVEEMRGMVETFVRECAEEDAEEEV